MDIKQALESAIAFEKRVRDAYRTALDRIDASELKETLFALAKDEHEHLRYLRDSYQLWVTTGQLQVGVLKSHIDVRAVEAALERARAPLRRLEHGDRVRAVLQAVLTVEEEAAAFYEQVDRELLAADRKYFSRFVEVERDHVAAVQRMLAAVS
jgi:rubrerythrin